MPLPTDFQFSQSSLQDFVDCPRRFELRYILKQKWPAVQTEPVLEHEHHIEMGTRFHRLVHQHVLGIPNEVLEAGIEDPVLMHWWQVFNTFAPLTPLPHPHNPEYRLAAVFANHRLIAQYDLLSVDVGHAAFIIDWKTSARRPSSTFLKDRLQTLLYPFLLVLAGERLNNGVPFEPEQIEMRYWFPCAPDKPEIIGYTKDKYREGQEFMAALINQINATPDANFMLTTDEQKCKYCEYRSLCNRGIAAGDWQDIEDVDVIPQTDVSLDIEQIGDIVF